MTKTVQVLAQMASNASIQNPQTIEQLLIDNNIETAISEAIINKDVTSLERQLDVCPDIVCIIHTPDEDDDKKDDDDSTEEPEQAVIGF